MKKILILLLTILLVGCTVDFGGDTSRIEIVEEIPDVKEVEEVKPIEEVEPKEEVKDVVIEKQVSTKAKSTNITSFHYQLQNTNFNVLKRLDVDLIIVDIDDADLRKEEIKEFDQIIVSYLSIGEAEDYRTYWRSSWREGNPAFLDKENPKWEGNYKVEFWDDEWQAIILEQVDKIIDLGYDGVYLDLIDAYEYYRTNPSSKAEMVDFVKLISEHAKSRNPDFLIITQNAPELYLLYKDSIDGVGKEDTWYDDNIKLDGAETEDYISRLNLVKKENKFVLAIDYPTTNKAICDFYRSCNSEGYACTVSNRDLALSQPLRCV